jgi:hypothetical protein
MVPPIFSEMILRDSKTRLANGNYNAMDVVNSVSQP